MLAWILPKDQTFLKLWSTRKIVAYGKPQRQYYSSFNLLHVKLWNCRTATNETLYILNVIKSHYSTDKILDAKTEMLRSCKSCRSWIKSIFRARSLPSVKIQRHIQVIFIVLVRTLYGIFYWDQTFIKIHRSKSYI